VGQYIYYKRREDTPIKMDQGTAEVIPTLLNGVGVSVHWTIKERRSGSWVVVREFSNLVTDYGLTALSGAPANVYTAPIYLVIETSNTTHSSTDNAGQNLVHLTADPTISGDTQLVLSVGIAAEETVTFSSKSGTGPFTFTCTGNLTNSHPAADPAVRAAHVGDSMSSVLVEAQYDPTFDAGNRATLTSSYSPGTGQNTAQFFLAGITATNVFFAHVGMADARPTGSGHLHNYASLGYSHNNTNDLEIDVAWTLQRF
jgi:hypothetical protein